MDDTEQTAPVRRHGRCDLENASPFNKAVATRYSRQIELELVAQQGGTAKDLVDSAIAEMQLKKQAHFYDTPLVELIEMKDANALEKNLDVRTVGEALETEYNVITTVPRFGPRAVHMLYLQILKHAINRLHALEKQLARSG